MNKRDEIITEFNHKLEPNKWTDEEKLYGKKIDIPKSWEKSMHSVIWEYKKIGWKVFWFEEKEKNYLEFEYPKQK